MSSRVQLAGSERYHPGNSVRAGQLAPDENLQITLTLRRKQEAPRELAAHQCLSRERFAELHGADPEDERAVLGFASDHHLSIVKVDSAARTITLAGPLGILAELFGADLQLSRVGNDVYRTRQGELSLPGQLAGRVTGVFGFDDRPVASAYFRRTEARSSVAAGYTPVEIAKLYNFPANTGKGQTIALIELGGGYREDDLRAYWNQLGVGQVSVSAVGVGSGQNAPSGDPDSADSEVVLDIEVAGAIAPDAQLAVYFAPNTDAGFLNAINSAIHDTLRKPSVISISWGVR